MTLEKLTNGGFPAIDIVPGTSPMYVSMDLCYEKDEKPTDLKLQFFRATPDGIEKELPTYVRVLNVFESADSDSSEHGSQVMTD